MQHLPLTFSAGVALWFTLLFAIALWSYFSYRIQVPLEVKAWTVRELDPSEFVLEAKYSYEWKGTKYEASSRLKLSELNLYAAKAEIKRLEGVSWQGWINPAHPERSVIERIFPMRRALYGLLSWAIFLYFAIFSRRKLSSDM